MDAKSRIGYRTPIAPPITTMLIFLALDAGLFGLILSIFGGGPWLFMVCWLIVMGGVGFGLLVLTSYELVVTDGLMRWRTAFRRGEIPMARAERVVSWPGGSVHVFVFRGGEKVRVGVMQGYVEFLRQLRDEYPQLPMPSTAYGHFVDHVRIGRDDPGDADP